MTEEKGIIKIENYNEIKERKSKLKKFEDYEVTDTCTYAIAEPICKKCGGKLNLIEKISKDDFDIEIRIVKRRNEFCVYECSYCQKIVKVPIPEKLNEENQYGSNVKAIAMSLVNEGYLSFKKVRELISGFTGGEMILSEGYISKIQKKCYENLEEFDNNIYKCLLKQKVIYWNQRTININGEKFCLRIYGNNNLRYYKVYEKKNIIDEDVVFKYLSKDIFLESDEINSEDFEFINSDCIINLINDLKKLDKCLSREWIKELINLLVDTNNKRKEYIDENILVFDCYVADKVIEDYDKLLKKARKINLEDFNQYYGKEEKEMIKRLKDYKEYYLLWILRFDITFSNNQSKNKSKIEFANIKNAEYFTRIKSYIETCKCHGIKSHDALLRLVEDNPYTLKDLKLK